MSMFDGIFGGLSSMFHPNNAAASSIIASNPALAAPNIGLQSAYYGAGMPHTDWAKALAGLGTGLEGAGKSLSSVQNPAIPQQAPMPQVPLSYFGAQQFAPPQVNIMSLLNRRF